MTDTLPILYSFRRCPYAMRARLALSVSRQKCALREVVLRDKPAQMIEISPKATVPVLHLPQGDVLEESLDIMLWALNQNDPGHWLSPPQGTRSEMIDLIDRNDGPFKHHLDRYKYPHRYDDVTDATEHRQAGFDILIELNDRLAETDQLFGAQISLADAALFPFIRQFANTDRDWFDAQPLPHLQRWLTGHLSSPLFEGIMAKYPAWQAGDKEPVFPGDI
ncbi:MAG: glutathione S-transferase [Alphaproteobacteria bacterium]|nr:glutathione S-transferase [Alphaproteobacteria bacterium]